MSYILCIDIGTTSLKSAVIGNEGKVFAYSRKYFAGEKSFVANEWVSALENAANEISIQLNHDQIKIDAICVSGNGPTLVSENGRTLLWNYDKSNISFPLKTKSLFLPQLYLFKTLYEKDYNESNYIFSGPEFLIWKLTNSSVTILPEERFKSAYWNENELSEWGFSSDEQKKLPEFVGIGFNAGNLTVEFQKKLNINRQIPVFTGGPDFVVALIGTNTLKPGKICDRSGSSEGINYCSEKPIFCEGVRTLPSVIPGLWNMSFLLPESGILLDEYRNEINILEKRKNSWEEIIDLCLNDKNSEDYRIITSICNSLKEGVALLKKITHENSLVFDEYMIVTGGQAKNDKWLYEKAYSIGMELAVCECKDAELIGDAVVANVGLGLFPDLITAAENLVKIEKKYNLSGKKQREMKVLKIPENLKVIVFDIDSTLYTNNAYAFEQVDIQIRHFAEKRRISAREARNIISEFRRNWSKLHEGRKISLGNTLLNFGVTIEESVAMRKDLLEPGKFLRRDEKLIETIKALAKKYKLICVTNNPVLPAKKTLEALGVYDLIPDIIGLDTSGKSKPAVEPFEMAINKLNVKYEEALSIGDRYDMDIALPLELGMGGILVTGVKDVYKLPDLLNK